MSSIDWPGFALTILLVELTPGPNMAWLAALTLARGRAAGFAATALDRSRPDYAMIATAGAASFVAMAVWTAVKSGVPPQRFPVIFMFSIVTALGVAGLAM